MADSGAGILSLNDEVDLAEARMAVGGTGGAARQHPPHRQHGDRNIPKGLLDSARVLNLKEHALLLRVILPGALPSICSRATLALVFAFVLLAVAELIGANS